MGFIIDNKLTFIWTILTFNVDNIAVRRYNELNEWGDVLNSPKFSSERKHEGYLRVNSCGKQWLFDGDYHTVRENGRVDYSLFFLSNGVGYYCKNGILNRFEAGSIILYMPDTPQDYLFLQNDGAVHLWSHFSGSACRLLDTLFPEGFAHVTLHDPKAFQSAFDKMILAHYKGEPYSERLTEGYMSVLISLIAQSTSDETHNNRPGNENIEKVLSDMHEYYNHPINIKRYAELCCVSEERFIRMFKEYTGLPPYRYQLKIRIDRAAEALENTSITVSQCAEMVGFSDSAYFSRIFKKFTGYPPSHYKK